LICWIPQTTAVQIGKLGVMRFPRGWYAYVGSAQGPGGVAARVRRHIRREKKLHWHIDYLLAQAEVKEVWGRLSGKRLECLWAKLLRSSQAAALPCSGFGASDCGCEGHLIGFSHRPQPYLREACRAETVWICPDEQRTA
jgi:Uri superfamily endonuclease